MSWSALKPLLGLPCKSALQCTATATQVPVMATPRGSRRNSQTREGLLYARRNGRPHLLVRIGNTRGNFLLHPEVRPLSTYSGQCSCSCTWC